MCHQSSHTTYTKKWSCRYVIYTQNYISCTRAGFAHVVIPENKASIHIMYNNVSLLRPHLDYKVALRLHFMLLTHGLPCTVVNNSRNKHRAETDRPALYNKNKPSQFRVKSPCLQRNVPAKKNSREHCFTKCAGKKNKTKKILKATNVAFVQSWATSTQSRKCTASTQQDMCRSCLRPKHGNYTCEVFKNTRRHSQQRFVPQTNWIAPKSESVQF